MAVTYSNTRSGLCHSLMKGAVEHVLNACKDVQTESGCEPLSDSLHSSIIEHMENLAKQGLRVLALAHRTLGDSEIAQGAGLPREKVETQMTFLGLAGIYDPPRAESRDAVMTCHGAGIEVHMLTGDHPGTARAIAEQVSIVPPLAELQARYSPDVIDGLVMTATQFDRLSDEQVDRLPVLPLVILSLIHI